MPIHLPRINIIIRLLTDAIEQEEEENNNNMGITKTMIHWFSADLHSGPSIFRPIIKQPGQSDLAKHHYSSGLATNRAIS